MPCCATPIRFGRQPAATYDASWFDRREAAIQISDAELDHLLATVTEAAEPDEALEQICLFVEKHLAGCRSSVLALDGWVLACAAAPNLPAEYVRAMTGLRLDPGMMPVGQSAVAPHPAPGFPACAWTPVVSSSGALLGILAVHSGAELPAWSEAVRNAAARLAAVVLERRGLERRMSFEANHDATTGLLNRRRFLDLLESEMSAAAHDDAPLSVLALDIDRFRQVNEAVGPDGGDRLLRYAGERLRSSFGESIVARTGSDEFAIASRLPSARLQEMARAALAGPFTVFGRELFVACAAGLATAPVDAIDASSLLQHAECALERSRARGSGDIVPYRAPRHNGAASDFDIEQQLRRALTGSELELKYQPLYRATGSLSGFEALLACGSIPPQDFIRVAEVSGMIAPIGAWVLDHACSRAAGWNACGQLVRLSVNVSAIQFATPGFVGVAHAALERSGLAPGRLELEITESVLMRDVEQSIRRMAELRRMGIRLAIDDFGTGFSSLNYLRLLPATTVKIDRSFIGDLTESGGARTVVESVIQLAHTLGFEVVAEGVETELQFTLLRAAGCDCVQGHYFGKAMPAAEVEELLKNALAFD